MSFSIEHSPPIGPGMADDTTDAFGQAANVFQSILTTAQGVIGGGSSGSATTTPPIVQPVAQDYSDPALNRGNAIRSKIHSLPEWVKYGVPAVLVGGGIVYLARSR